TEVWVWPRAFNGRSTHRRHRGGRKERRGVSRTGERAAPYDRVGNRRRRDACVDVDKIRQAAAETSQVTHRNDGVLGDFTLYGQVGLLYGRILKMRIKEGDVESRRRGRLSRQNLRQGRRSRRGRSEEEGELPSLHASIDQSIVNG